MGEAKVTADPSVAPGSRAHKTSALFALPVEHPLAEWTAILLLCPILLSAALWNGFPIIFYDTGAYVLEGLGHVFVIERSPVYSLFLLYAGAANSFWMVVVWQALMTAFVMTEFARAEAPKRKLWEMLAIAAALVVLTGIAWYVGQIEPDCMTALVVLSVYLLAFRASALGWPRSAILLAIAVFAIACHPSHLGLAAGLTIIIALLRLAPFVFRAMPKLAPPNVLLPFTGFVLGIALVLASNYDLTKQVFISKAGPVFVFARLLQDGIVKKLLDDTCPQSGYALCAYRNELPTRADAWLWDSSSPFNKLGRFQGTIPEATRIVADSIRRYPLLHIQAAFADAAEQFVRFKTGDQIEAQEWILYPDLDRFVPHQMEAYMRAKQQRGQLHFAGLNIVHQTVAVLSLLGLVWLLWRASARREWESLLLPGFVLLALAGNAFICGALSNPHDRYQSRLIWLPTFALALTFRETAPSSLRRPVESGT